MPVAHVVREFSIDRVYFVPAYRSPHKRNNRTTDAFHRVAMLALAIRRFPKFLLSTFEVTQGKIVYSVDTLQHFSTTLHPRDRLFFIVGADSFVELGTWKNPARLLQLCDFIIINRGVTRHELIKSLEQLEQQFHLDLRKRVHFSSSRHLPVSSTEVRNAILHGRDVSGLVPADVERYMHKHSLYHGGKT